MRFWATYVPEAHRGSARVLAMGAIDTPDVAGRDQFDGHWTLAETPDLADMAPASFGVGVSVHQLQRTADPVDALRTLASKVRADGQIFIAVPSDGEFSEGDLARFSPEYIEHIAAICGLQVVARWHDERGPYRDVVAVLSSQPQPRADGADHRAPLVAPQNTPSEDWDAGHNEMGGQRRYLECLADLHQLLAPQKYVEIGIRHGRSLALASCTAVGIDPDIDLRVDLGADTAIFEYTSDDFFADPTLAPLANDLDVAFIDGMHLVEFVLRDFIHIERHAADDAVVIIDDVYPNHVDQATRLRNTRVWTGDVWKIVPILERFRPDLTLTMLDTYPTGLLLVSGLDPASTVLNDRYDEILAFAETMLEPPVSVIGRDGALSPERPQLTALLATLRPSKRLPLSVVVVAYNMARELPRTIRSLSPHVQGLDADHYEIIVMDNGSDTPVDQAELRAIAPNVSVVRVDDASVSPVGAINTGMAMARGALIGMFIDGARMASPGLLSQALACNGTHTRSVIGTFGFHLGHQVQSAALETGYDQAVEDDLLDSVGYESDGYALFDISVFASSSVNGWGATPVETNALFMARELWDELGGYDARFQSPGGGVVNHDTWQRAVKLPDAEVFMLLGEGTFHQFHGGVATNSGVSHWKDFIAEFETIRGRPYKKPHITSTLFGTWPRTHQAD